MKENKIKIANTSPEGQAGSENMSTADVDAVMKKYDRESNIRVWTGKYKLAVRGLLVAFSLWCIYVTLFATFLEEIRLTSFLGLIILIGFLTYPAKKGDIRENYMPIGDIIFMIAGAGAFLYFTFSANQIINQGTRFAPYQIVIGIIGIAALIELTRRCVGLPILFVAGFFLIYALAVGLTNPAFLGRVKFLVRNLFYTKEGIFSTPVNVCSKYIVVFIIFGAFLERTGISNFFIQLANCIAGKYAGGPAKVAVISSALCGMVSGSSVGNTVTTGSVTIPMMNPPLLTKKDVDALIRGLKDGSFKVISTDHAPHAVPEKTGSIRNAAFGIVGIETSFALSYTALVETGILTISQLIEKMSWNPAQILGSDRGTLQKGHPADIVIADIDHEYKIDKNEFASKGRNTPFDGWKVKGKILYTICDGKVVYQNA